MKIQVFIGGVFRSQYESDHIPAVGDDLVFEEWSRCSPGAGALHVLANVTERVFDVTSGRVILKARGPKE